MHTNNVAQGHPLVKRNRFNYLTEKALKHDKGIHVLLLRFGNFYNVNEYF